MGDRIWEFLLDMWFCIKAFCKTYAISESTARHFSLFDNIRQTFAAANHKLENPSPNKKFCKDAASIFLLAHIWVHLQTSLVSAYNLIFTPSIKILLMNTPISGVLKSVSRYQCSPHSSIPIHSSRFVLLCQSIRSVTHGSPRGRSVEKKVLRGHLRV